MTSRDLWRWIPIVATAAIACSPPSTDEQEQFRRRGDDLLGSGDTLFVAEKVAGDVMLAGGTLDYSGTAGGSYIGIGGEQAVGGRIDGSLRAAGGQVVVTADVGRNATVAGGEVRVDTSAVITHNAYLAGGSVRMAGAVGRDLAVAGGEVLLNGAVGGDVDVSAQRLTVGPGARVTGALRHRVPKGNVIIDPGARIAGGITVLPARDWRGFGRVLRSIWLIGFLVAGLVVVALFPALATAAAASTRERAGVSAAFGAAWLFGIPLAIALAAATVVGIPLAALLAAAYVILAYLGRAVIAVWLGELLIRRWTSGRSISPVASFLLGGAILVIVGLLPVIGGIVGFIATLLGAGALLVSVWPRRQAAVTA